MWAVSGDGQSHRIVSMHQLRKMLWPVCLPVFTQFPYHAHQCLVSLFHLSIGLSMVQQSPNLPYAHKLAKFSDNVAFKIGHSVAEELGWCSEDWDVTLPQKLSNSFCSLIRGHICYDMFCKVVEKTKRFTMFWGWSSSIISMPVKSTCNNSKGVVTMIGHIGALTQMP